MRLILWLVVLPLAVYSAFFGVNNRGSLTLDFDPVPYSLDLPIFAGVLGAILIGLIVGGVAAWLRQGKWRRETRKLRRDVRGLEAELEQIRAQAAAIALAGVSEAQGDPQQIQDETGG